MDATEALHRDADWAQCHEYENKSEDQSYQENYHLHIIPWNNTYDTIDGIFLSDCGEYNRDDSAKLYNNMRLNKLILMKKSNPYKSNFAFIKMRYSGNPFPNQAYQ